MEAILRWLSGLVRAGGSDDDAGLDWILLITARATIAELELSVYLLWLAQETSLARATADKRSIQAQRW